MSALGQIFFTVAAGREIRPRSKSGDELLVLCSGWAFRHVQLSNGGRQILKFLFPGDVVFSETLLSQAEASNPSYSAKALTDIQLCSFSAGALREKCRSYEIAAQALLQMLTEDVRTAYELVTVLGQHAAEGRIAHLLLSLMRRVSQQALAVDRRYPFPLRQQHVADAVGLTPVHVSRVLTSFRDRGLLTLGDGMLVFHDLAQLDRIASLQS
ncbi:Crp/Fnr family transcriptional regulator [Bradyrhizobium sp. STM 3843]|uniref:Crp/Fnr family transcriptional regulator n=1 Tax=Bradyrhizobium sp. STM 3843 TaxID=551947 RepID=UPI0006827D50|nr:Crp/Fnr family transcriptional regulator [Bradyrhizobium sp. STM 3843]